MLDKCQVCGRAEKTKTINICFEGKEGIAVCGQCEKEISEYAASLQAFNIRVYSEINNNNI